MGKRIVLVNGLDNTDLFDETDWNEYVNNNTILVGYVDGGLQVLDVDVEEEIANISDDSDDDTEDRLNLLEQEKGWYSVWNAVFTGAGAVPEEVEKFCEDGLKAIDEFSRNAKIGDTATIFGFECECVEAEDED